MVIYTMGDVGGGNGLSFDPVIAMFCIAIRHEVHVDVIKTHFTGVNMNCIKSFALINTKPIF